MEVVVDKNAGQIQGVVRMSGAFPECEVKTLIRPDRTTIQVRSSGWSRVGIGRSSWKGLSTGCHEKAPVRCPCCQLTALHGAPWTLLLLSWSDLYRFIKAVTFWSFGADLDLILPLCFLDNAYPLCVLPCKE